MGRPKKEDEQDNLHPYEQLNKSIDLGEKHDYRFLNKSDIIQLDSSYALKIKDALSKIKSDIRGDLCVTMMESKVNFDRVISKILPYQHPLF